MWWFGTTKPRPSRPTAARGGFTRESRRQAESCPDDPEPLALNAAGGYAGRLGRYDEARGHCEAALVLNRDQGNRQGGAGTLDSLGYVAHHEGRHAAAVTHYEQALALFREAGDTYEPAVTLDYSAHPQVALGRHDRARTAWREALDLYRAQGRAAEAERVRRALADPPPAGG